MFLKKGLALKFAISILLVTTLFSCSPKSEGLRIAFVPQLIGIPYFTAMEKGGNRAAEQFGGQFLYVGPTKPSVPEQDRLIKNLIAQKVDAIAVGVIDASVNGVLKEAQDAGINVLTTDSDSPDSVREVFVAQADNKTLGYMIIDRLALQINNEGQIGIVSGPSTSFNLNVWIEYMKEKIAAAYPNIEIVDIRYTDTGEQALQNAQELIARYPDIKGLIGVASHTIPGTARAVEQANRIGEIAVIGYGSPNTVRPYIKSGVMKESILWDPEALGFLTYWAGMKQVKGEAFEEYNSIEGLKDPVHYDDETKILLLGDPLLIDAENIDDYDF